MSDRRQQSCLCGIIGSEGGTTAISRNGKKPLSVSVNRFGSETCAVPKKAAAIVFITDPERPVKTSSALMTLLFGFTEAECRLAGILITGCSLKDAAEQRQVTYETVRSQLKSIFGKTGVRRQTELIELLIRVGRS